MGLRSAIRGLKIGSKSGVYERNVAMGDIVWRSGPGARFYAEVGNWRVTVEGVEWPLGGARFLVYHKEGRDGPGALVCSGVEEHVRLAMEKAEHIIVHRSTTTSRVQLTRHQPADEHA